MIPSIAEREIRAFHDAYPGATSSGLARTGSYERLAARVPPGARVLDLGAGDGHLCALLAARGARPIALDLSRGELARLAARPGAPPAVQARAQAMPFAAAVFDACVSHLAFLLMDDAPAVVAELARVLAPGAELAALLGGGPAADADPATDAFAAFLAIAGPRLRRTGYGDPRTRTEAGWRALFTGAGGWSTAHLERHELDASGTFDEVWRFLGASYELRRDDADAVRAELAGWAGLGATGAAPRIPCRIVTWLGSVRRWS